jgi:hypothetical protein
MSRIAIIVLLLAFGSVAHAQSFKERLVQMRKEYDTLRSLHLKMSIRVFENDRATQPFVVQVADVKREADNYKYQLGETNMLMNSKYTIVTDAAAREIVCSKRSLKDQKELFKTPVAFDLDSILNLYETPKVARREGDLEHYIIEQKKTNINRIDMFIDVNNNHIRKLEYRYKDAHYVVIEFPLFDTKPVFETDTFHEKHFVIAEKTGLRASTAFRGYRVVMMDK